MDYQIRRMKRKTVGIYISNGGSIEVRAPHSISKTDIDRFVQEKEAWIKTQQAKMLERRQIQATDPIQPGGMVVFLGKKYPSEPSQTKAVSFDGTRFLLPNLPEAELCPTRWKGSPAGAYHVSQNTLGLLLGKRRAQFFLAAPACAAGSSGLRCCS